MLRRGARRPPQSTRARIPQKFGSGSVGSEMQPKPPFFPNPAQKKKKTRISTHTDVATVPARLGKSWPLAAREEPGPERGRCLRLAARGAAAGHHRSQVRRKCLASPARLNGRPGPASPRPRPGWSGRGRDLVGGDAWGKKGAGRKGRDRDLCGLPGAGRDSVRLPSPPPVRTGRRRPPFAGPARRSRDGHRPRKPGAQVWGGCPSWL
ncbi:hypothetical protein H1C71_034174 [Ictidomys tridecemlineatus]|nr:hypothetical protein H1C71_034174 [Ictidomys tridecemlineatus]